MKGVTLAWVAWIAAATWRYEQDPAANSPNTVMQWAPPPSTYLGGAVAFSLLGLLAQPAPELAATMGWALVVGSLVGGQMIPTKPKRKAAGHA